MTENSSGTSGSAGAGDRLLAEFPIPTLEQWHDEVVRLLKGAPYEKKMLTQTWEGITLQPMVTRQDVAGLSFARVQPGDAPYVRATAPLGHRLHGWDVAQELPYPTYESFNEALRFDMERGQTAVNLLLDRATQAGLDPDQAKVGEVGCGGTSIASLAGLAKALDGVNLETTPLYVQPGSAALPFAALVVALMRKRSQDVASLRGSIGMDPLCGLVSLGTLPLSIERAYEELALLTRWAMRHAPAVKTLAAYSFPYHDAGGNAVQELAFTLATAVEHLRQLERRGLGVDDVAPRVLFGFSVGSNFFMEIAKLRAARMLWARVVEASGGAEASRHMTVHARTSSWNKTTFDCHVNILRATTEAFSAVMGGADSMHVGAFDEALGLPSELGRRIARNTQTILKEECHFDAVVDPAGGSWYVEKLTAEVAGKAWALFQQIEAEGGMLAALGKGTPQRLVAETAAKRRQAIAERREVIVGVNQYPNAGEVPVQPSLPDYAAIYRERVARLQVLRSSASHAEDARVMAKLQAIMETSGEAMFEAVVEAALNGATIGEFAHVVRRDAGERPTVEPVAIHRGAAPFEDLRHKVLAWRKGRSGPQVFLATVGPVAEFMPRLDFTRGFYAVGGFEVGGGESFENAQAALDAAVASGAPVVVITSTDDRYPEAVPVIAGGLKAARPGVHVVLAGLPKDLAETFKAAGVDEFIHVRSDVHASLSGVAARIGVAL
jgi:methylmalonyl-CoA mutase